jgi:hypothetical protein
MRCGSLQTAEENDKENISGFLYNFSAKYPHKDEYFIDNALVENAFMKLSNCRVALTKILSKEICSYIGAAG